jgi:NitT/TauT family transport system substrate-binding protein
MVPTLLNPDGYLNVENMAAELRWLEDEHVLPHSVPIERVVDHSYLEAALSEIGLYRVPSERE